MAGITEMRLDIGQRLMGEVQTSIPLPDPKKVNAVKEGKTDVVRYTVPVLMEGKVHKIDVRIFKETVTGPVVVTYFDRTTNNYIELGGFTNK